jgi:hypothetical protein
MRVEQYQQQNNQRIEQIDYCSVCGYHRLNDVMIQYQDSLCNVCFNIASMNEANKKLRGV